MKAHLILLFLLMPLAIMAQDLVAVRENPVLLNNSYCLARPKSSSNYYAQVNVYTLGFDVGNLNVEKDGRCLDIKYYPDHLELFFLCDGTSTTLTFAASGYGSLRYMFDSKKVIGNIESGKVYELKIRASAPSSPSVYDITQAQYIDNLSHLRAKPGVTVTFEVLDRPGYTLDYVMVGSKKIVQSSRSYSFTMPSNDVHIMPHFTKNTSSPYSSRLPISFGGKTYGYMIQVPGGSFQMGSNDGDSDEKPPHTVSVNTFYIGETEVTQELWKDVMGDNPSNFKKGDNYPVEMVSWNDCQTFIKKLNEKTGKNFRLPTEAEWEFAARGGKSGGTKYSGSDNIEEVAWYSSNSGSSTHQVKSKKPNTLGIYDMSGNVWEWCNDWYASDYYKNSPSNNPQGPSSGSGRVLRGGSWSYSASYCRVANRGHNYPDVRSHYFGFRLALVP